MSEFRDMDDIIEKIKDVISYKVDGKVFDKHVAHALKVSQDKLAQDKKRNSIPHLEIYRFCRKYKVSIESMIFKNSTVSSN